jgi:hypothetical protein
MGVGFSKPMSLKALCKRGLSCMKGVFIGFSLINRLRQGANFMPSLVEEEFFCGLPFPAPDIN